MEIIKIPVLPETYKFTQQKASILINPIATKIAQMRGVSSISDTDDASVHLMEFTIDTVSESQEILDHLLPDCTHVSLLYFSQQPLANSDHRQAQIVQALAKRNVKVSLLDARAQRLKGLASFWYTGRSSLEPHQQQQPPETIQAWHASPPPCNLLITHSPSWSLINNRLAKRIGRHEQQLGNGNSDDVPVIVAELGPHELSIHKIDSTLNVVQLAREPFLGYRNLIGMARLSAVPIKETSLWALLDLAAQGDLAKLDLTIGDLLPPGESSYGNFDPRLNVFALGKLHDRKTLDEIQPSQSDVAASLVYTFIKTFFDTIVHATSAHGIPRVIVAGEFFEFENCRKKLMETWNFTGVPKEALKLQFLREDCSDLLALTGGFLP